MPFMLFISIAIFCAGIFFLRLIMEIRDELAPDWQLTVDPNGVKSVAERDQESKADIRLYGLVCFLLGAALGGALASGVSNFVGAIDMFINLRRDRKFLEFADARYVKLVHGPMLGDVTPTSAKIWLRTDREASVTLTLLEDGKLKVK